DLRRGHGAVHELTLLIVEGAIDSPELLVRDGFSVDAADFAAAGLGAGAPAEVHPPLEDHEGHEGERRDEHDHLRVLTHCAHHRSAAPTTLRRLNQGLHQSLKINRPGW